MPVPDAPVALVHPSTHKAKTPLPLNSRAVLV